MIELRNLTKAYPVKNGYRYVLRDVSLIIPSRTNLAILGPNGAGKSTLLRMIGGAEPANSGAIITDEEISWPFGLTSGFQGSLTGRENILFVCRINGLNFDQSRHVTKEVCDFAEIGEYFDMPVSTYSSGMRGRLSFGLSVAFEFDVYLIDELTSMGDTIFREKAKAAFERIRKRASLIFVSHNLKSLKQSCQSALFIRDGTADFYANIDDGIEAYSEYVREHRNHQHPDETLSKRKKKKANAIFDVAPRVDSSPDDISTGQTHLEEDALSLLKRAKKAERKARRAKRNDLASTTEDTSTAEDTSVSENPRVTQASPAEEALNALKRARKAKRKALRAENNHEKSPAENPQTTLSSSEEEALKVLKRARKVRRDARRDNNDTQNSPEDNSTPN